MSNKIEIALYTANNETVSLSSMSVSALDSFVEVITSLKAMAEATIKEEDLIFSIKEGSAACAVESKTKESLKPLYDEMDLAIKGQSKTKVITDNLRKIQTQIKREDFGFRFNYRVNDKTFDIHSRLVESKRIGLKRKKRIENDYKLKIIGGLLNQIGGKDPNYHFDYGDGLKITINCTMEQAIDINQHLYKKVNSLVVCKQWIKNDHKDEYFHRIIVDKDQINLLKKLLKEYYSREDLVDRLSFLHEFFEDIFNSPDLGFKILNTILIGFNSEKLHQSELKTLLIISKSFKTHKAIKNARIALLETYNNKRIR